MELQPADVEQNLSCQRVTVAMKTAGRKPDQNISRHDGLGINHALAFDHSDDKPGQIIFILREIARMLSGLAADQNTTCLTTALSDATHHHFCNVDVELAADEVV